MLRPFTLVLLLTLTLCAACTPPAARTATPSFTPTRQPSATPAPTAVPPTPSPTPPQNAIAKNFTFDYKVVYARDGFSIREAFLGKGAIWRWDDFPMPPSRIGNTIKSLRLGQEMACDKKASSNMPCAQTLTLSLSNGQTDEYLLRLADVNGGAALLMKNGKLLWTGMTNGANSFAILSSKRVGDEIAFEYSKSNWGNIDGALWISPSILITRGKTIVLISDAFAPNAVGEKLIYFKLKSRKEVLVFDGVEVGDTYNDIFNLRCCWHGPAALDIASDGKAIDFFAQKGDGWYHVQAGYLDGQ